MRSWYLIPAEMSRDQEGLRLLQHQLSAMPLTALSAAMYGGFAPHFMPGHGAAVPTGPPTLNGAPYLAAAPEEMGAYDVEDLVEDDGPPADFVWRECEACLVGRDAYGTTIDRTQLPALGSSCQRL